MPKVRRFSSARKQYRVQESQSRTHNKHLGENPNYPFRIGKPLISGDELQNRRKLMKGDRRALSQREYNELESRLEESFKDPRFIAMQLKHKNPEELAQLFLRFFPALQAQGVSAKFLIDYYGPKRFFEALQNIGYSQGANRSQYGLLEIANRLESEDRFARTRKSMERELAEKHSGLRTARERYRAEHHAQRSERRNRK